MAKFFLPNPGFELGDRDWNKESGWTVINDAVNSRNGAWVGKFIGTTSSAALRSAAFGARPGNKISTSVFIDSSGATQGNGFTRVAWLDKDGLDIGTPQGSAIVFGGIGYAQSVLTAAVAPDRTKSVSVQAVMIAPLTGTWYVDDFVATGDIIESIPTTAPLSSYRVVRADTVGMFDPLLGPNKFTEFNAGMSDKWSGVFNFTPAALGGDLNALLAFLGRVGNTERFFAFDPDRQTPVNGVVNGMSVDGVTTNGTNRIPIKAGPVSSTALVAGDYIEVKDQFFQLLRDLEIGPEGTGEAIVWPAVRSTLADGEDVITDNPKIVARITSNLDWTRQAGEHTAPSISWEEV